MSFNAASARSEQSDDSRSEAGDVFEAPAGPSRVPAAGVPGARPPAVRPAVATTGVTRSAPPVARVVGRGAVGVDRRKYFYDVTQARSMPKLPFGASRADRMDAAEAGLLLDRIHQMFGIDTETEDVLSAFDKALFFEHTVNGASILQSSRGVLRVGDASFELAGVKRLLGESQRRFFRAFADDIATVNREVLAAYDDHNPEAVEMHGQLMQVAVERGLQKYPHLAHDSSDAGSRLSIEERNALMLSKRVVLESTVNRADAPQRRVKDTHPAPSSETGF